ncbi:hypothetical protein B7463_g3716, partial [Scytalidium lignicola]
MVFVPEAYQEGSSPVIQESTGEGWTPLYWKECSFPPEIFSKVMLNQIRNPNINSSYLFRADILFTAPYTKDFQTDNDVLPRIIHFRGLDLKTVLIRTLVPRKAQLDKPLDQTCLIYSSVLSEGVIQSLVVYLPHLSSADSFPYYHPAVRGIAFFHTFSPVTQSGICSIHFSFFQSIPREPKLERIAHNLLATLHKHGEGSVAGYVKRVHHDVILPQATVQNTYSRLKAKYAKGVIDSWVETTDPTKHVFEDLGIAAFLIELWAEMYREAEFPGFVDIGCGNGLLVYILTEEGYKGYGFDARKRKSWEQLYSPRTQERLKELVLIPSILIDDQESGAGKEEEERSKQGIHDGTFPRGTFIISNHADELTPWTPLLANISESPFMMIPCCSHALSGARCRAPPSKEKGASNSAYASLIHWVSDLATQCGWEVETEMLRIPSTRNTGLIGRRRVKPFQDVEVREILRNNGGAEGWEANAMKLTKGAVRGH